MKMNNSVKIDNTVDNADKKLDKKILDKVFFRWLLASQTAWNYEKMQGLGYCYAMLPALRKIYKDEDELNEAVKNHLQFFNCNIITGQFILGANLAIEESGGAKSKDAVASIKTGLMGPLAGIGDTIFGVTWNTVFGSIAAYMALQGSAIGCYIWIIANIVKIVISKGFLIAGYKQGVKLVTSIGDVLKNVTDSASMLGLMVIGALIPTVIKAKVPYVYTSGQVKLVAQEMIDKIMPALIPLSIVGLTYWLLGRKRMNSTRVIILLIVLSIIAFNFKILG
ncbi:PTS system mannose/fructose/sorbose family transporter subunit IID [Clostridium swellfunianum]|uniref:PTS system mannose/fructose/sorbose family transporter subunit IID n=1 Tax=Clostridium swellfunianum TaxID=1367462 RepID=UPI00202E88E2|nr:PTS system mannose/fructose/sorbose family transporter subunit IID [Clostridium swellfunianum]